MNIFKRLFYLSLAIVLSFSLAGCGKSIEEVVLSTNSLTVMEDETKSINYDAFPEDADTSKLEWRSADETVATVSESGEVTGISPGNTNVYVVQSGNRLATCEITVTQKSAYDRLSDKEKAFVDSAMKYIDSFKSPTSVVIKAIEESKQIKMWSVRIAATNGFGGTTVSTYYLMDGEIPWGFVNMDDESITPDSSYDVDLITAAIQELL